MVHSVSFVAGNSGLTITSHYILPHPVADQRSKMEASVVVVVVVVALLVNSTLCDSLHIKAP